MSSHNILRVRAVAVVTGAASGLGLAAVKAFAQCGMRVYMVDRVDSLSEVAESVKKEFQTHQCEIEPYVADVSKLKDVLDLRDEIVRHFGPVHVLLNNAGVMRRTPAVIPLTSKLPPQEFVRNWNDVLNINIMGVVNMCHAFAPFMAAQECESVIINTGSKQGITSPPGNAGYNVSKAAVKIYTEQLSHELRNMPAARCSAHLFIPGWVWTPMNGAQSGVEKPPGCWTPEETVAYMIEQVFEKGEFYVLCPDNETPLAVDHARIEWSARDIIESRPGLSRWHPKFKPLFETFLSAKLASSK